MHPPGLFSVMPLANKPHPAVSVRHTLHRAMPMLQPTRSIKGAGYYTNAKKSTDIYQVRGTGNQHTSREIVIEEQQQKGSVQLRPRYSPGITEQRPDCYIWTLFAWRQRMIKKGTYHASLHDTVKHICYVTFKDMFLNLLSSALPSVPRHESLRYDGN